MITVAEVNALVRSVIPGFTVVGNEFKTDNPDDCAYTRFTGGPPPNKWSSVAHPSIQIVIRAKTSLTAETKANEVFSALHSKTEFYIGKTRVIKCLAEQPTPWYLGTDSNSRTLYSINFTLTTTQ